VKPIRALLCILFALGVPAAALAQATPQYPATASTRYIDSERLGAEPPKGIAEYAAALKGLAAEFAPLEADLKARAGKLQELERGYDALRGSDKIKEMGKLSDEYEAARRDFLRHKENADMLYRKRSRQLLQPITERIGAASQRFARIRGFPDLRFAQPTDLGQFAQAGAREVTADFVAWYANNPVQ
jgi:Skp family chaperone for outer membrane proteins